MSAPDAVGAIRRLYFATSKATIGRDFERAVDLLKSLPDEESRARAAVFMDGLAQLRSEWGAARPGRSRAAGSRPPRARP